MKLLKFSIIILAISLAFGIFGTLLVSSFIFFTNPLGSTFLEICLEIFLLVSFPVFIFAICIGGLIYIRCFSEDNEKR